MSIVTMTMDTPYYPSTLLSTPDVTFFSFFSFFFPDQLASTLDPLCQLGYTPVRHFSWGVTISTLPDIVIDEPTRLGFDFRGHKLSAVEREAYQVKLVAGMVIALADDDEMPLPTWDAVTIHVYPHVYPNPKTYNIPLSFKEATCDK